MGERSLFSIYDVMYIELYRPASRWCLCHGIKYVPECGNLNGILQ